MPDTEPRPKEAVADVHTVHVVPVLGWFVLFSVVGFAQTESIDPAARKDIDAGNQAWVQGMKEGSAAKIASTYTENAIDCTATGECYKGRAAIEAYLKGRIAKARRPGLRVGSSEVAFANGQKVAHRYLTVWQRQPRGGWKIFRNMPMPDDAPR